MHSQVNNQIANSLNSAENLMQAIYVVIGQSNNTDNVVETLIEKLHGDIQNARCAFQTLAPGFLR